jgi:hypothetical protein
METFPQESCKLALSIKFDMRAATESRQDMSTAIYVVLQWVTRGCSEIHDELPYQPSHLAMNFLRVALITLILLLSCSMVDAQNKSPTVRSIVQEPETSFEADVAATRRVIDQQGAPCLLVAHSYGGAVITEAGNDPLVIGLVYVAAHMPDKGESEADDGKRFPSDLSRSNAIKKTADESQESMNSEASLSLAMAKW